MRYGRERLKSARAWRSERLGRDVFGLVIGDGLTMAAWGIALGAIVVAAAAFLLRSAVFGVRLESPVPFVYSTALVAAFGARRLSVSRLARGAGFTHGRNS